MIAYGYWNALVNECNFGLESYLRKDLARPFFERYEFCDAWHNYNTSDAATMSIDLPAYVLASLTHSLGAGELSCVDALGTPRGQIIALAFVPLVWYLIGKSVRRLAKLQLRPETQGLWRLALVACAIALGLFGAVLLGVGVAQGFAGYGWNPIRMIASAFWAFYAYALAAERLRVWPFKGIETRIPVQDSRLD